MHMAGPEGGGGGSGGGSGGPPTPPQQQRGGQQVFTWIMIAGMIGLVVLALQSFNRPMEVTWTTFKELVEQKKIYDGTDPKHPASGPIVIDGTRISAWVKPGTVGYTLNPQTNAEEAPKQIAVIITPDDKRYKDFLDAQNKQYKEIEASIWPALLINLLPVLLIIGIIWFIARSMRGAGGGPGGMLGNFGKSRHRMQTKEQVKITFGDVAGVDEAKEEVQEIVEFLKNPKRFSRLGGRIPRGVLLSGSSGLRQDAARQGDRRRGRCAVLLDLGLRLRGDVRGRRRQPRARPLQASQGKLAVHHLPRRDRRRRPTPRRRLLLGRA